METTALTQQKTTKLFVLAPGQSDEVLLSHLDSAVSMRLKLMKKVQL
jgi:hypothetical protein